MSVIMYNCDYGDCFAIEKEHVDRPLYVDFGIHILSELHKDKKARNKRYDDIINLMPKEKDFLLTHYHEDHYNGLLYLKKTNPAERFENVYIPDIWDTNNNYRLIKLSLLGSIYDRDDGSRINLADFLKAICNMPNIHLVSRGDNISKNFVALWPDKDLLTKGTINMSDIDKELDSFGESLTSIAQRLYENVMLMVVSPQNRNNRDLEAVFSELSEQINSFAEQYQNRIKEMADKQFDNVNNISIVFRNKRHNYCGRNMLFTGDIGKGRMKKIASLKTYPMLLKNYSIIKIPHHGTNKRVHYYDFTNIAKKGKSYFLVTNGTFSASPILDKYVNDADKINATMIVSDEKGFQGHTKPSRCIDIASSGRFFDII